MHELLRFCDKLISMLFLSDKKIFKSCKEYKIFYLAFFLSCLLYLVLHSITGSTVNAQDSDGNTALHVAMLIKALPTVGTLGQGFSESSLIILIDLESSIIIFILVSSNGCLILVF